MNPFSILESDDEEEKPIVVPKKEKQTKKEKPVVAPKTPPPAPVEVSPPISEKPNSGRGGSQRGRGGGGRGRGQGEKKGGKPPKHEFERHSGTGRGKEVSKGGSGKGNWGNPKEEAEHAEKEPIEEVVAADTPVVEEENSPGLVVEEPATPEVVEPVIPTFTLDEYLAKRGSSKPKSEGFGKISVRKVDATGFSGFKTVEESEDTFIALGGGKTAKKSDAQQRSAKTAKVLDVGFSVAPAESPKEGGGRGRGRGRGRGEGRGGEGRGEGRGRGGRGGGRRNNSESKVDIHDSAAFPSL